MPQTPFVGPAYTGRIREVGWDECLNLYCERTGVSDGKYEMSLLGTPGTVDIASWVFPNGGIVRGMYTTSANSLLLVVCGNTLYQIPDAEDDAPIALGTITTLTTKVSMVDDGRYLSIADGSELWVMDLTNTSAGFTTPLTGMVRPNSVEFIGGYTICNNTYNDPAIAFPPTSNLVYYSTLYNASKWYVTYTGTAPNPQALRYFAAEGSADAVKRILRIGDCIWLFGSKSYEVHMLSENQDLPFSRVGGSLTDIGIYAPDSAARIGDTGYFVGVTSHGGIIVYKTEGYNAIRISNHAIEYNMDENSDPTQAIGWTYEQEGHKFYVITFRGSDLTICYDEEISAWHNRSSRELNTDKQTCWEPIFAASRGGDTYVGSTLSPRIFRLSLDQYTEWDGRPIKRIRSGPIIWDDLKKVRHNSLQIDMHTGIGSYTGLTSNTNPQVMMRFSDDNGHTWSNEYWADAGQAGNYKTRVRFNRLGMAYSRIYEITITDAVPVEIIGASVITDSAPRQ